MANDASGRERPEVIAVTGATGTVGQFVVRRLLSEGVHVRAAIRPASQGSTGLGAERASAATLERCAFDMQSQTSAYDLLRGCDALVHCAFEHERGRYRGGEGDDPRSFWQHNLAATMNLLEACKTTATPRAIVLSSRAVFGATTLPTLLDESSPQPDTHYGALKRAEESLVRISSQATAGSVSTTPGLAVASLRPTGVYGVLETPEASKWFAECQQVLRGLPVTAIRAGTEVHGDDVADAIWRMLTCPPGTLGGRAFNCSDQLISTRMIARQLNQLTHQALPLPDLAAPAGGAMRCEALRSLGWRPGGSGKLQSTLAQLLQRANSRPSSANEATR